MSYCIPIRDGFITMCETDFLCPTCQTKHTEEDWFPRLHKSDKGLIYRQCKNKECKEKLGVTTCMMGDVKVWRKKDEEK